MQKDIRDILKDFKSKEVELSANHSKKFEDLLMKEIHSKKSRKIPYQWLSIAASVILVVSIALQWNFTQSVELPKTESVKEISLGNLSPELKTIESYYKNTINYEISNLTVDDNNKEILEGYLTKISELTKEYKLLTKELNIKGVNDDIISALINNLQLRLQLLQQLKSQLNNLNTNQNENQYI